MEFSPFLSQDTISFRILSLPGYEVNIVSHYHQPGIVISGSTHVGEGAFNVGLIAGSINEIQDGGVISRSNKQKNNKN